MSEPIKIHVFNNGGSPGWYSIQALCECGHFVAGHICSHEGFAVHDMGFREVDGIESGSNWKHDAYRKHLAEHHPGADDWRLRWVSGNPLKDTELMAAYERHKALPEPAEKTEDAAVSP